VLEVPAKVGRPRKGSRSRSAVHEPAPTVNNDRPSRLPPPAEPKVVPTDAVFTFTSDLAGLRRESNWRFAKAVIGRRKEVRDALARLRDLPRLALPVDDSRASRALTQVLRKGVGPVHPRSYAVAVLEIPAESGAYRKGRARQALRTNSAKAQAAGVVCCTLSGQEEILLRFGEVVSDGWGVKRQSLKYRWWSRNVKDEPHAFYFAALGPDGSALVFCKLIVVGDYARLHTFIHKREAAASLPRFLLTEYIVEKLCAKGVKFLFVDTILALHDGLRFHQHLIGYTPQNIILVPAAPRVSVAGRLGSVRTRLRRSGRGMTRPISTPPVPAPAIGATAPTPFVARRREEASTGAHGPRRDVGGAVLESPKRGSQPIGESRVGAVRRVKAHPVDEVAHAFED
jgi:hypothetical protein